MLAPKNLCTGCTACYAVCPISAITVQDDEEGFKYPFIDQSKCTKCGLCAHICPVLHPNPPREPIVVYAAHNKDDEVRIKSSSGGIFTVLAQQILKEGGVVYGAGWGQGWRVTHKSAQNETELEELRGSKYVQSAIGSSYQEVRKQLERGRKVLFSGTPCQIAGLKAYLQNNYHNLVCVDVICHATPSPKVFAVYKQELEEEFTSSIRGISFRSKIHGWKKYSLDVSFENSRTYRCTLDCNPFLAGFLNELYNRPSCHQCQFRDLRSNADITLGDYWGVGTKLPLMDDDKGTSAVCVNTNVGERLFVRVSNQLIVKESEYEEVKKRNSAIYRSPKSHVNREAFFKQYERKPISSLINKLLRPAFSQQMRKLLVLWRNRINRSYRL